MGSWGNTDDAANSVYYAPAQFKTAANTNNQTALFGNTTADAFITNLKVGQFGVDTTEARAARGGANTKMAHAGWNLRVEGTGGRAGRVQYETLVAMSSISNDASDDAVVPDYKINITTNPANRTSYATNNQIGTFTVAGTTTPSGGTLGYFWQKHNGTAFANLSNAGAYSNTTTATLSVLANTASNGEIYRAGVTVTGGATAFSSNAVITIIA
jgi:hypothetical protein